MAKDRRETSKSVAAEPGHHIIRSLEVTGGGFLRGNKLEFVDGLNCIIGGFGTGKTTVLELMRQALDLVPDAKTNPERAATLQQLIDSNLQGGRVRLSLETKLGMHYVAERGAKDATQVLNKDGGAVSISLDRDLIFQADIFSQNEIQQVAKTPQFLLELIDKHNEESVRRIEGHLRKVERELTQSTTEILRLEREVRELAESAQELPVLEEKLKALRHVSGPDGRAVSVAHARRALRDRERTAAEALRSDLGRVDKELESCVAGIRRRLESRVDSDIAEGPNEDVVTKMRDEVLEITELLDRAVSKVKQQCVSGGDALERHQKTLAERHAKQEAEYRVLLAKSQEESGRAAERQRIEQRHLEVSTAAKELELRQAERQQVRERRRDLLSRLSGLRDERYAVRKRVADQLTEALQPNIRVSVTQAGRTDAYRALLQEGIRRSGIKHEAMIKRILTGATPEELCRLVQKNDVERLVKLVGSESDKISKLVESFRDTPIVYQIEAVELEDLPHIELLDGETYKDSVELSHGQRCTVILPILLLESERPLIIDQPEDNLDNAYIYQTVVKTLRVIKRKRQVIFVTHNANIPVLGEADRVFVMESNGQQARLKTFGTVDDCKEDIEFLLEGGAEAFLLRKKRYGH